MISDHSEANGKKKMKARKNLHGVTINACCASCQHVTVNSHGNRKCLVSKMPCAQQSLCSSYMMQDALKNLHIGGADGQVKKAEYLYAVLNALVARQQQEDLPPVTPEEEEAILQKVRIEWIRNNGDIYVRL